nr:hypothetical protein [Tanacetum cinerariifolium]
DLRDLPARFGTRAHGDVEVRCGSGFGTVWCTGDLRDLPAGFGTRAHGDVEVRCGSGFGTVWCTIVRLGTKGK